MILRKPLYYHKSLTNLYHTLYVECDSSFIRIPTCSLFSYVNPTITTVYNFFTRLTFVLKISHIVHLVILASAYNDQNFFSLLNMTDT